MIYWPRLLVTVIVAISCTATLAQHSSREGAHENNDDPNAMLGGQCITPTLIGHRLTINPFLVFLSIACWSWMWGPVGAFLGVPILLCAMVAMRRLSSTGENAGLHVTAADSQAS